MVVFATRPLRVLGLKPDQNICLLGGPFWSIVILKKCFQNFQVWTENPPPLKYSVNCKYPHFIFAIISYLTTEFWILSCRLLVPPVLQTTPSPHCILKYPVKDSLIHYTVLVPDCHVTQVTHECVTWSWSPGKLHHRTLYQNFETHSLASWISWWN